MEEKIEIKTCCSSLFYINSEVAKYTIQNKFSLKKAQIVHCGFCEVAIKEFVQYYPFVANDPLLRLMKTLRRLLLIQLRILMAMKQQPGYLGVR